MCSPIPLTCYDNQYTKTRSPSHQAFRSAPNALSATLWSLKAAGPWLRVSVGFSFLYYILLIENGTTSSNSPFLHCDNELGGNCVPQLLVTGVQQKNGSKEKKSKSASSMFFFLTFSLIQLWSFNFDLTRIWQLNIL